MHARALGRTSLYTPPQQRLMVGRDIAKMQENPVETQKTSDKLVISTASRAASFANSHAQKSSFMLLGEHVRPNSYTINDLELSFDKVQIDSEDPNSDWKKMLVVKRQGQEVARFDYNDEDARLSRNADGSFSLVTGEAALENGTLKAQADGDILLRSSATKVDNGVYATTLISLSESAVNVQGGSIYNRYLGVFKEATIEGGTGKNLFEGFFTDSLLHGSDGKNEFIGSFAGSQLAGGSADDLFKGYFLQGTKLEGLAGNDTFSGFFFNSHIDAGEGDDRISADMTLLDGRIGKEEAKYLYASIADTTIDTGSGDDSLEGVVQDSTVNLGEGNNRTRAVFLGTSIKSGSGNDRINALYAENSHFENGSGSNRITLQTAQGNNILAGEDSSTSLQLGAQSTGQEMLFDQAGKHTNFTQQTIVRADIADDRREGYGYEQFAYGSHKGNAVDARHGDVSLNYATQNGMVAQDLSKLQTIDQRENELNLLHEHQKLTAQEEKIANEETATRQQELDEALSKLKEKGRYSLQAERELRERIMGTQSARREASKAYGAYRRFASSAEQDGLSMESNRIILGSDKTSRFDIASYWKNEKS